MREFGVNTIAYLWALNEGIDQNQLLEHVHNCGAQIVEVRREYIKKEQLAPIAERAKSLGLTVYYSVPEPLFKDGFMNHEMLEEVMAEAVMLTAKCMKFSLGDIRGVSDREIKRLVEFVNNTDKTVLIENSPKGPDGDVNLLEEFFMRQDTMGGTVGLTFDTGNFEAAGFNPLECAKRLHSRTRWIHLKDMKRQEDSVLNTMLGEGDIDFNAIVPMFAKETPAAIEYPCSGYEQVAEEIKKALDLLRNIG